MLQTPAKSLSPQGLYCVTLAVPLPCHHHSCPQKTSLPPHTQQNSQNPTIGSVRSQGCPLPGCHKSAGSRWDIPARGSRCPPLASSRRDPWAAMLPGKNTLNKQPAACTLPAENARALYGTRATAGPVVAERGFLCREKALSRFPPYFSWPLTYSFFKITFLSHTQRHLCSLPFLLKIIL